MTTQESRRARSARRLGLRSLVASAVVGAIALTGLSMNPAAAADGSKASPLTLPMSIPGDFVGSNVGAPTGSVGADVKSDKTRFWAFTAQSTGPLSVCTYTTPFEFGEGDTTLEIWSGQSAQTLVASNDDDDEGTYGSPIAGNSGLTFNATASTRYVLGLGGYDDLVGSARIYVVAGNGRNACKPTNSVTGSILDSEDDVLDQYETIEVVLSDEDGSSVEGTVGSDGNYSIPKVPAGEYDLFVSDRAGNYLSATSPITIGSAATSRDINLSVSYAGFVTGTITSPGGVALSEEDLARLEFYLVDTDGIRSYGLASVDSTFRIGLGGLSGQGVRLRVSDGEWIYQTYVSQPMNIAHGQSRSGVDVRLSHILGTPTALTVAPGDGQATLRWTAATTSVDLPVTDYAIRYSANGGSSWSAFDRAASTATQATVSGLANGTRYVFQVAAVNDAGVGTYSASIAVTPGVVASPPASQQIVGSVPAKVKRKGKKKSKTVTLPKSTNAGVGVRWKTTSPKVCKVVRGKLVFTGKKGACKIVGTASASATHTALNKKFTVKVA
ncbi:MAG: fibronectin type III domain-containing protein [Candidatus Nanopelagicales bacterium]